MIHPLHSKCLLLPLAALAAAGCGRADEPQGARDRAQVPAVEVVQARHGGLPLSARFTGTVRAGGEVAIYPQTDGSIVRVYAEDGDAVQKGGPLVQIKAAGTRPQLTQARSSLVAAQAEVRQAEASLKELVSEYERTKTLGEQGLVPANLVATQRAQVEAARANVARLTAQVAVAQAAVAERAEVAGETMVRAPISGRVGMRNAEVGMRVDAQSQLFVVGSLDDMRVEVPVPQEALTDIRVGQRVELGVQGSASPPIAATVSRISPFVNPGSLNAEIEVDVPNEARALVPGMFVTAEVFHGESQQATLLPASAVYDHPGTGERGVYVASSAPAPASAAGSDAATGELSSEPMPLRFRRIDLVAEGPQTVAIDGVQPGEWVVVVGQHLLAGQAGGDAPVGYVRAVAWERILELQHLQRQDLLERFMAEQQRLGRAAQQPEATSGRGRPLRD